jgi:outer membrane protein TolC
MARHVRLLIWLACACGRAWSQAQQTSPAPAVPRAATLAAPPSPTTYLNLPPPSIRPDPFRGSTPAGKATAGVLPLSLNDAITRSLQYNLGLTSAGEQAASARAARLRALSALLPNLTTATSITREQVNLAAFGFTGFPGIPQTVGPFNVVDTRAYLDQSLVNFTAWNIRRAANQNARAALYSVQDARDTVVYVVVSLYLEAIAGTARITASEAQVSTSQALYNLAADQRKAGIVPGIDVLRAQVELQSQQQRLIFYINEFEKQKLNLARAIGLPTGQRLSLTDHAPYAPLEEITLEQALDRAFVTRADYKSAQLLIRAAEFNVYAARAERFPSFDINGNYGDIGQRITQSHGTFSISGTMRVPIFQGGRVRADIQQSEADLRLRRAEAEDLRGRIDADVRTAFLDLRSAEEQLKLAQSSIELSRQQLQQSQDRFAAGVTNNIEVVQAQESVATSYENYISSLYSYNLAKASLARALGLTAEAIKRFLGGP